MLNRDTLRIEASAAERIKIAVRSAFERVVDTAESTGIELLMGKERYVFSFTETERDKLAKEAEILQLQLIYFFHWLQQ